MKKSLHFIFGLFFFNFSCFAQNSQLTYIGALKEGGSNGLVPKWSGGLTSPPENWSPEIGLVDPFSDDIVIDVIDHTMISKYADFLSLGLKKLLKQNHSFKIYLYPSRRSIN